MSLSNCQKKRIAIWAVFGAAAIALVAALIFYIKDTFRENDLHTQSVEAVTLLPVAEAYSGADEILGTSVTLEGNNGEHATLTFPETISRYQPENAYLITNITGNDYDYKKGAEQIQADAPRLFKIFFGDRFDEICMSFMESEDEFGHMISEDYNGNNGETAYYQPGGYMLIDDSQGIFVELNIDYELSEEYFYKDDPELTVELLDGTVTLKAAADKFSEYLNNTLAEFNAGFEIRPYKAQIKEYNSERYLTLVGEQLYEGIPFESCFSSLYITNNGKITSYLSTSVNVDMLSVNSFISVKNYSSGIIAGTQPVDKIISLKDAVDILKENLAKNADYTFTDIKLMYCCKHTQNEIQVWEEDKEKLRKLVEENNAIAREFRPTWYFIISEANGVSSGIKVDAITGEITMDIP